MSSEYYLLKNLLDLVREEGKEKKEKRERVRARETDRQTSVHLACA